MNYLTLLISHKRSAQCQMNNQQLFTLTITMSDSRVNFTITKDTRLQNFTMNYL